MRVLLQLEFAASRKEPLAQMLDRALGAFDAAGIATPTIHFSFGDAPLAGHVSSVDRVLKRFADMQAFLEEQSTPRRLTNREKHAGAVELDTLRAIAAGVPRSFPFHTVALKLSAPELGQETWKHLLGEVSPGILIQDSWWVNGRNRALTAFLFVEATATGKKLPPLPEKVAKLVEGLGKIRSKQQFPMPGEDSHTSPLAAAPEVLQAVTAIVQEYRAKMPALLEPLPHDLPSPMEALRTTPLGTTAGPKKPTLVKAFKPLGYDRRGDSGTFTLTRRTAANLTLEISLDVGTWSNNLTAHFAANGLGYRASLPLPPTKHAGHPQYPIGDAARWQQLVENLVVLVSQLEQTFVPAIEAASGPAPDWYQPQQR